MGFHEQGGSAVHRQDRRRWMKRGLGVLAAALLWPGAAGATGYYTSYMQNRPYVPLPLAGGSYATISPNATGDGYARVQLPFPVGFYGNTYTSIVMTTEGMAMFAADSELGSNSTRYNAQAIPNPAVANNLIALWWRDSTCPSGSMRSQTTGEAPNRAFVLEWFNCYGINSSSSTMQFQLHLREGKDVVEVHYGAMASTTTTTGWDATVGVENGTGTEAVVPLGCNKSCNRAHFPTNQKISYFRGPDSRILDVTAERVVYSGTETEVRVRVGNGGNLAASDVGVRFWLSADATVDPTDTVLGTTPETLDLAPGEEGSLSLVVRLPRQMEEGHYLLAELVQPIEDAIPENDVGRFGPLVLGPPTPDAAALPGVLLAEVVEPGGTLALEWLLRNVGNDNASEIEYLIVLSENDFISIADRILFRGTAAVPAFDEVLMRDEVTIPVTIRPGVYHVGLLIDPAANVREISKENNAGRFSRMLHVQSDGVSITTPAQLAATAAAEWSVALSAEGGDGWYEWSRESGTLPPGISIHTERQGGRPVFSTLKGTPSTTGLFSFALRVQSGSHFDVQAFDFHVTPPSVPLVPILSDLPPASYGIPYDAVLLAAGGEPPYSWEWTGGKLPTGLRLAHTGLLSGTPLSAGIHEIAFRVTDARGRWVDGSIGLVVSPPGTLTCPTKTFPRMNVGEPIGELYVEAAGGAPPYTFSTLESRRIAVPGSNNGETFPNAPPPGLRLDPSGKVEGTPEAAGSYVWLVSVRDRINITQYCSIAFDVAFEQGPSILTTALPDAYVDTPYVAHLTQFGGNATSLTWSLAEGNRLPEGLALSADGRISGMASLAALEGASERIFPFVVRVRDGANQDAVQPLSIRLHREARQQDNDGGGGGSADGGGCQAAGGELGLLALAWPVSRWIRRRGSSAA